MRIKAKLEMTGSSRCSINEAMSDEIVIKQITNCLSELVACRDVTDETEM